MPNPSGTLERLRAAGPAQARPPEPDDVVPVLAAERPNLTRRTEALVLRSSAVGAMASRGAGLNSASAGGRRRNGEAQVSNQAELARASHGFGTRGDPELAPDALRVGTHRVERYVQVAGHLAVAQIRGE